MSKRNIAYVKPAEPSFIRKLKEQVGYKEGPNVNTKREKLSECSDGSDVEDESPQIVVVKPGDLSADDIAKLKQDEEEGRADLSRRVMFKRRDPNSTEDQPTAVVPAVKKSAPITGAAKRKQGNRLRGEAASKRCRPKPEAARPGAGALSFQLQDDEDDEEG